MITAQQSTTKPNGKNNQPQDLPQKKTVKADNNINERSTNLQNVVTPQKSNPTSTTIRADGKDLLDMRENQITRQQSDFSHKFLEKENEMKVDRTNLTERKDAKTVDDRLVHQQQLNFKE